MKSRNGASRVVAGLRKGGVRCVFGLPGTQIVELFEALRQDGLRTVLGTNELSAAFMAGGWARVTGEPGVLITIPGPGFTWALTALAEAKLDSVPLVHITGTSTCAPGNRRFRQQDIQQRTIASPLVKRILDVDAHSDFGVAVLEAIHHARAGEPGPVLLQIPPVALREATFSEPLVAPLSPVIDRGSAEEVCARVRAARRPVFIVGQGVNQHARSLLTLVERVGSPVITSPSARGAVPEDHPLNLGFDPLAGGIPQVNELLESSDLIVVMGCKLGQSSTGGYELKLPADRLIHVDASGDVLGANYPASLNVVADVGAVIEAILASNPSHSDWTETEIVSWRGRISVIASGLAEPRVAGTRAGDAKSFFETLRRALPRDTILVLDSGLHQILARRHYRVFAPCGLLVPTNFQSMGFGISTAIGAKLAKPQRPVVALIGDGGFAMMGLELLTAVREGIQLIVIVFVDGALGQIRAQQLEAYGAAQAVTLENPDFSLFAESVGARYRRVGDDDLELVMQSAFDEDGVSLIEVSVEDALGAGRAAAFARVRETTRQVAGPRVYRLLADTLKLTKKMVGALRRFSAS